MWTRWLCVLYSGQCIVVLIRLHECRLHLWKSANRSVWPSRACTLTSQAKPKHKIVQATFMSCVDSVMQQEIFSFMQLGITGNSVHERLWLVSLTALAFGTSSHILRSVPRIVSKIFTWKLHCRLGERGRHGRCLRRRHRIQEQEQPEIINVYRV